MHTSVQLETPCEIINVVPLNPLISKCQIKVCYVGDEPNRNKSVITKEAGRPEKPDSEKSQKTIQNKESMS